MQLLPGGARRLERRNRRQRLIARARDVIVAAGRPLHINEILKALGKPVEVRPRVALAGGLARDARRGVVFERTAPNTFGVVGPRPRPRGVRPEPPDDFGLDDESASE